MQKYRFLLNCILPYKDKGVIRFSFLTKQKLFDPWREHQNYFKHGIWSPEITKDNNLNFMII